MFNKFVSFVLVLALILSVSCVPSSAAFVLDDWAIIGVVSSLVLICGFTFADYQSTTSFASDLWNRIKAVPDRFADLISGVQSLVSDTYDSVSNVVSISGDLLQDFVVATEEVLDVSLYPVLSSPSVSVQNNFYVPVMRPFPYGSSSIYYQLSEFVSLSSLSSGLNLLYSSNDGAYNFYLFKDSSSYQLIGKIDSYFFRLGDLSTAPSSASSFGLLLSFSNSSGTPVILSNFVNGGWQSASGQKGVINLLPCFFASDGSVAGTFSGIVGQKYYSTDPAVIGGSSTSGLTYARNLPFSFSYQGNYTYSLSLGSVSDFLIPYHSTSSLSASDFVYYSYPLSLLCLSLAMGLDKGIGYYDSSASEIPIFQNPVISGSDDSLLDVLIPMPNIDIKFPSDVNSPDNVLPLSPVDLVVSEIDVPEPVPPSDPSAPVIPDIDTSGILHYITDFFESIADFFSFLFGVIGSLPTSLTYPIFGAFLLLVMIGIIIICL